MLILQRKVGSGALVLSSMYEGRSGTPLVYNTSSDPEPFDIVFQHNGYTLQRISEGFSDNIDLSSADDFSGGNMPTSLGLVTMLNVYFRVYNPMNVHFGFGTPHLRTITGFFVNVGSGTFKAKSAEGIPTIGANWSYYDYNPAYPQPSDRITIYKTGTSGTTYNNISVVPIGY